MKNSQNVDNCRPSSNMQKHRKYNLQFFHEKSLKIAKKNKNLEKIAIFKDFS